MHCWSYCSSHSYVSETIHKYIFSTWDHALKSCIICNLALKTTLLLSLFYSKTRSSIYSICCYFWFHHLQNSCSIKVKNKQTKKQLHLVASKFLCMFAPTEHTVAAPFYQIILILMLHIKRNHLYYLYTCIEGMHSCQLQPYTFILFHELKTYSLIIYSPSSSNYM